MAKTKEYLKKLSELCVKITGLAKSIKRAEEDLKFQWVDEIEEADIQKVKDQVKAVEDAFRMLQDKCHIEGDHCRETRQELKKYGKS